MLILVFQDVPHSLSYPFFLSLLAPTLLSPPLSSLFQAFFIFSPSLSYQLLLFFSFAPLITVSFAFFPPPIFPIESSLARVSTYLFFLFQVSKIQSI